MPNDAKLGLVVGVGLTIAVAVVFFSKEPAAGQAKNGAKPAASKTAPAAGDETQGMLGREPNRLPGQTTGWQPAK